ncbi:hypothetical protein KKB69_02885 [Patescibacteria group bacterium]|nr:hypothetical protein [Patescibacteria group bacterium]
MLKNLKNTKAVQTADTGKSMGTLGDIKISLSKTPVVKTETVPTATASLPQLDAIVVPEVDAEEIKKKEAERKEWATSAATKLVQIQDRIAEIEANAAIKNSAEGTATLQKLRGLENQLLGVKNETAREQMIFSALMERIHALTEEVPGVGDTKRLVFVGNTAALQAVMDKVVAEGRFHKTTRAERDALPKDEKTGKKKWPAGTIFCPAGIYFSNRGENGEASNGQKALEAELRKLVNAYEHTHVTHMGEGASDDVDAFLAKKSGIYHLFAPATTVAPKGKKPYKLGLAHLRLRLSDLNADKPGRDPFYALYLEDAAGSAASLVVHPRAKQWYVPFYWVEKGQVVTGENRMDDEKFKWFVSLLRTIERAVAYWQEGQKAVSEETAPPAKTKAKAAKKTVAKKVETKAPAEAPATV